MSVGNDGMHKTISSYSIYSDALSTVRTRIIEPPAETSEFPLLDRGASAQHNLAPSAKEVSDCKVPALQFRPLVRLFDHYAICQSPPR